MTDRGCVTGTPKRIKWRAPMSFCYRPKDELDRLSDRLADFDDIRQKIHIARAEVDRELRQARDIALAFTQAALEQPERPRCEHGNDSLRCDRCFPDEWPPNPETKCPTCPAGMEPLLTAVWCEHCDRWICQDCYDFSDEHV